MLQFLLKWMPRVLDPCLILFLKHKWEQLNHIYAKPDHYRCVYSMGKGTSQCQQSSIFVNLKGNKYNWSLILMVKFCIQFNIIDSNSPFPTLAHLKCVSLCIHAQALLNMKHIFHRCLDNCNCYHTTTGDHCNTVTSKHVCWPGSQVVKPPSRWGFVFPLPKSSGNPV